MEKELQSKILESLNEAQIPLLVQSLVLDVLEKFDFKSESEKVAEFRTMMNQPNIALVSSNTVTDEDVYPFIAMLFEEFMELVSASGDANKVKVQMLLWDAHEKQIYPTAVEDNIDDIKLDEIMDAIVDMRYHLANLSLSTGLHEIEHEAFDIVHTNNMTKATKDFSQLEEIQEKYKVTASREKAGVQGFYVYKCENDPKGIIPRGKVLKPIDYVAVNLGKFIREKLKTVLPVIFVLCFFGCEKVEIVEATEKTCNGYYCTANLGGQVVHDYSFTERCLDPNLVVSIPDAMEQYKHLLQDIYRIEYDSIACNCK